MTKQEFNETKWTGQMKAKYNGNIHDVISVDFGDGMICLSLYEDDSFWTSYDKVTLCEVKDAN